MKMKEVMRGYDYDMPLLDALGDPELSVARRVLAGAMIGEGLDTAYFATCEMVEAIGALEVDRMKGVRVGEGVLVMEEILKDKNPLQMKLWHLVCERAVCEAMLDLAWLKSLTYRRGRMARVLRDENLSVEYVPARDLVAGPTAADMMLGVDQF